MKITLEQEKILDAQMIIGKTDYNFPVDMLVLMDKLPKSVIITACKAVLFVFDKKK